MKDHKNRDDFSRFLVHLCRDYNSSTALENLRSILRMKKIEARNPHCLFHKKIKDIGFSKVLQKRFNTVCLTEVPLNQIQYLTNEIRGRQIKLKPYGLVFWKQDLLDCGANPAVYVNSQANGLREFLLHEFDRHFENQKQYRTFRKEYDDEADSIIEYYSLINIISKNVDFSWEREWRHSGDLKFELNELVAIIADNPQRFLRNQKRHFSPARWKQILKLPIISPEWNYEQLVEDLTIRLWESQT
ncbi:MAG: hypothetical protein ACFB2W_27605 [Leptolyngbyaceae cyanobacterium]